MNDLFIGGGGIDGVTFLGSLEFIHQNNLLDLKSIYGCSIGAYITNMYITGKTPLEILDFILKIDINVLLKMDIKNFNKNFSILSHDILDTLLEGLGYDDDTTLKDVFNMFNIHVNIYVTNIDKNTYEILSDEKTPEIKIKDAIKASMSIPFLFPPVNINDELYLDGCCKNIYGSPPDDRFISGYSIILEPEDNYFSKIIHTIFNCKKPRGSFIVTCNKNSSYEKYLTLNNKDKLFLIDMYSKGVKYTKEQLF